MKGHGGVKVEFINNFEGILDNLKEIVNFPVVTISKIPSLESKPIIDH